MRQLFLSAAAALTLATAACAQDTAEPTAAPTTPTYSLDLTHASLIWRVSHGGGLSMYTARFTDFDADLVFDAADLSTASVTATIDPTSVETNYPGDFKATHPNSENDSWNAELANAWFGAQEYPQITFTSTAVEQTGENTGTVTGDLTFMGVTQPVTLDVTFNGEAEFPWNEGRKTVGFSATGTVVRSNFGLDRLIPNVGDEVEIIIEAEFVQDAAE